MKTLDCHRHTRQGRFDHSVLTGALRYLGIALLLLHWAAIHPNASSQSQDEAASGDHLRDDAMQSFKTKVQPFVKKYCVDCHNTRPEAQLNLESALRNPESAASFRLWKKAIASVKVLDMPPEDAGDMPTDQERQDFLDSIAKLKYLAPRDPGPFILRRLSKVEFGNTLHALYGVDRSLSSVLPDEVVGEGYLNSISPLQSELYLGIANRVIRTIIVEPGSPPTDKQKRLLGKTPADPEVYRAEAKRVAFSLASDAYRRPPIESELDALLSVFDLGQENQLDYMSSLVLMWKAILVSPQFLFITPQPSIKSDQSIIPLDDYQLASRLSYLLWSHPPDDELRALAESGTLSDPKVMRSQVQRLLADAKSRALFDTFGAQWLSVGGLLDQTFDPDLFPEMTLAVRNAMLEEARWFFQSVVSENQSIFRFIDSDYTFVSTELADWYGIERSNGAPTMQRVKITDPNRGGILGMPAVLASTSWGQKTQPSPRHRENRAFKRWLSVDRSRTYVLSTPAMFPRSFAPERRQYSIARGLDHAGLHFTSHQGSFLGFNWQSVRFNILNPTGYERGLSKNSQNGLETNLAPATQDPSIAVACDRGVFSCARRGMGRLIPLSVNGLRPCASLSASLFSPHARHVCPHDVVSCSPDFG